MGGICGIVSSKKHDYTSHLSAMLRALSHRGSQPHTVRHEGPLHLGITGGTLIENGREKLLFDGPNPPTNTQNLYSHPSPYAFAHIEGEVITLAKDPLGSRPLYWTLQNGQFIFASELKSLIQSNLFTLRLDLESLSFYLSLGYFPVNKTPFKNVYKVRPGHKLVFTPPSEIIVRPTFSFSKLMEIDDPDWSAQHYESLAKGIIDRSALSPDKTAALSFEANDCESVYGRYRKLGIDPVPFHTIAEELPQILWHLDEPLASAKILSFWRLCEAAQKEGISDLLLSAGSVEWLSRHIHRPILRGEGLRELFRKSLHALLISPLLKPWRTKSYFDLLRMQHAHPWHTRYIKNQYMLTPHTIKKLTHGQLRGLDPEIIYHSFPPFERLGVNFSSLLYLHQKTSLIHNYMAQYDRIPTAFGIKAHAPFCETPTLEYLATIPEERLSHIIRRISSPEFDKALFAQTTLIDYEKIKPLFAKLKTGVCVQSGLIDPKRLDWILRVNLDRPKHFRAVWTLLILEVWMRLFFENPLSLEPPQMKLSELLG